MAHFTRKKKFYTHILGELMQGLSGPVGGAPAVMGSTPRTWRGLAFVQPEPNDSTF